MKLKRILAPLAALLLALALTVAAYAAEEYIHGYFRYTVEDDSVTITAYLGRAEEVTVPSMIDGTPVNVIAAGAFANNRYVKTVTLPDTIMEIREGAFAPGQKVIYAVPETPETPEPPAPPTPPDEPIQGGEGDTETPPAPPTPTEQPEEPRPKPNPNPVVAVSTQRLTVDGAEKAIDHYNIDGYNYFKLRDLACLLRWTKNAFDVVYDEQAKRIELRTGKSYTPIPGDLVIGGDLSASAVLSGQTLRIDGKSVSLLAYNIGGYNYFMLRDLAPYLGFDVDYDEATRTAQILTK